MEDEAGFTAVAQQRRLVFAWIVERQVAPRLASLVATALFNAKSCWRAFTLFTVLVFMHSGVELAKHCFPIQTLLCGSGACNLRRPWFPLVAREGRFLNRLKRKKGVCLYHPASKPALHFYARLASAHATMFIL